MKKIAVYYANYDLSEYSNTLFKKTIFTLVLSAIGTSLIVIGFTFGLLPFAQHISAWHQSKNYISVDAKVIQVEFLSLNTYTTRKGRSIIKDSVSKTYQTKATFAYQYQGKKYLSNHVNLLTEDYDGRDNYPKETFDQLNAKYKTSATIMLWLNPQHPDYAVYDRSIIWPAFILLIPFALAFPIAGSGLIFYAISLWSKKPSPNHSSGIPVYRFLVAEPTKLTTNIFIFLIYNLIMLPIAPNAWLYGSGDNVFLLRTLVIVWGAFGLFFPLFSSIQAWKSRSRLGELYLLITPPESRFSKTLHGQIQFVPPLGSRLKPSIDPVTITLNLEYFGRYLDRRDTRFNFSSQWHSQDVVITAPRNTVSQNFELTFPDKIMASPYDSLSYKDYYWVINVEIAGSIAQFKLPAHPNIPLITPIAPMLHKR